MQNSVSKPKSQIQSLKKDTLKKKAPETSKTQGHQWPDSMYVEKGQNNNIYLKKML